MKDAKVDLEKGESALMPAGDVDVWAMEIDDASANEDHVPWSEMNGKQRAWYWSVNLYWLVVILGLLYLFIVSLGLLGTSFLTISGTSAGQIFSQSQIFDNPLAGLCLGILVTVLVQSSSTSTSIIITMTAAGLLTPNQSVYMIMGANIGTSVTSTIVAMGEVGDTITFQRAFAGAVVHDMFNFLSVLVLFPIEVITGYLITLAEKTVDGLGFEYSEDYESPNFLKLVTKPFTNLVISVDKGLISDIALNNLETNETLVEDLSDQSIIKWKKCYPELRKPDDVAFLYCGVENKWSDTAIGLSLLAASLFMLIVCLVLLVKALKFNMKGSIVKALNRSARRETAPGCFAQTVQDWFLVLVGCGATILVQSSSITTSTLTPIVGLGALSLEKMLAITVGANVGTTFTGLLAAFASENINVALTVSFTHIYFNISGTMIWFALPFMRQAPLTLAKTMGKITVHHRWFALAYLLFAFFLIPLGLFGLSLISLAAVLVVFIPLFLFFSFLGTVVVLRTKNPDMLPDSLREEFHFLPMFMRTEPAFLKAFHNKVMKKAEKKAAKREVEKAAGKTRNGFAKRVLLSLGD